MVVHSLKDSLISYFELILTVDCCDKVILL